MRQEEIAPIIEAEIEQRVTRSIAAIVEKYLNDPGFFDRTSPATCGIPETEWLVRHGFQEEANAGRTTPEEAAAWKNNLTMSLAAKFIAETPEHERTLVRIKDWMAQQ